MGNKQRLNALVIDSKGFALEHIDEPTGEDKTLGRRWRYGKSPVYLLRRRKDTENGNPVLEPVELPEKLGETPEKLFRALSWEREAEILFTLQNTLLEKLKIIGVYVLIGILLLFIFLIFSSL